MRTFQQMRTTLSAREKEETTFDPEGEALFYLRAMADDRGAEGKKSRTVKLTGQESTPELFDLAIGADSKIYVLASGAVLRLNSDGTTDASYGEAGVVFLPDATSIHPLPDGRQIVVNNIRLSDPIFRSSGQVARLLSTGASDPAFGVDGVSPAVSTQANVFRASAILADGAVLAVGNVGNDSLLARIVGVETTSSVIEYHNTILNHYFDFGGPADGRNCYSAWLCRPFVYPFRAGHSGSLPELIF